MSIKQILKARLIEEQEYLKQCRIWHESILRTLSEARKTAWATGSETDNVSYQKLIDMEQQEALERDRTNRRIIALTKALEEA